MPEAPIAVAVPSAATIINVDENTPPVAMASAPDSKPDPLAHALEGGVRVPANTIDSALNATPAVVPAKVHVETPTVQRAEPVKLATERVKATPPKAPKAIDPIDNDVSLISALVAHTEAEPQPAQAPAASRTKRQAKPANPDIVERHAGDSTSALIKRCKRLGGTEAKLCQRRICAGHGGDAACKAK